MDGLLALAELFSRVINFRSRFAATHITAKAIFKSMAQAKLILCLLFIRIYAIFLHRKIKYVGVAELADAHV